MIDQADLPGVKFVTLRIPPMMGRQAIDEIIVCHSKYLQGIVVTEKVGKLKFRLNRRTFTQLSTYFLITSD
jgi:hypothetical protein